LTTPQFRAQWNFHFRNNRPAAKEFGFPESGIRNVPMVTDGLHDELNTVRLIATPNYIVEKITTMELDCELISFEHLKSHIQPGTRVWLWDGEIYADGQVISIYQ